MTGPPSLQPPVQPASDEGEGEVVSQEAAGLPGPAHLAHLLPPHQVSTAPSQGPATMLDLRKYDEISDANLGSAQ